MSSICCALYNIDAQHLGLIYEARRRPHGLKNKEFHNIRKFCPIIDTTATPYYGVGKYLAKLLNPLATSEFSLKDSFDTTTRILPAQD